MPIKFPCVCCQKPVKCKQRALLCTRCSKWIHISCASVTQTQYDDDNESFENWICPKCIFSDLPYFSSEVECVTDSNAVKVNSSLGKDMYSPEKTVPRKITENRGLQISHINVRSLRNKKEEIIHLLDSFSLDILALSETWLSDSISSDMVSIDDYVIERKDRDEYGGGVACYIRRNIPYVRKYELEHDQLELIWLEIRIKNQTPFFLGIVYRKPNYSCLFFDNFESNLDKIYSITDNVVILGDLNCNMLTKSPMSNKLNELLGTYQMSQLIKTPTRITPYSSTLIDLICVSSSMESMTINSGTYPIGFSDHSLVHTTLSHKPPKLTPQVFSFRSFRSFDTEDFLRDISKINWDGLFSEVDTVDTDWDKFKEKFSEISNIHAPFVSVRKKLKGNSPWITKEYLALARDRDYHKKKFDQFKKQARNGLLTSESSLNELWEKYRCLRNKVNGLNKKLKKSYYHNKLQQSCNNTQNSWKILKDLLPKKKKTNVNSNIKIGLKISSDKLEIANAFNDMFIKAGEIINAHSNGKIDINSLKTLTQTKSVFKFTEINEEFVASELKSLDTTKAMGPDNLHPRLLKEAAPLIAKPLTKIFNKSLISGLFPDDFKKAKVVPVPKDGDLTDISNYRPISLLSCVSKILEKAVHNQLYNYLQEHRLLSQRQSGFRRKHSTATCLVEITDYLLDNLDKGIITGAIFLDLRKAFDVISHLVLLAKLPYYGINDNEIGWFTSYLSNRKQCVSYQGTQSNWSHVKSGVPQGSILGPLLFCLCINDLCSLQFSDQTKIALYADDTAIFCGGKNIENIQRILQKEYNLMDEWFKLNRMQINAKKTKVMMFGTKQKIKNKIIKVKHGNDFLENVTTFKYLGVILDQSLNWSLHVSYINKKINRAIACIRRIHSYLNESTLAQLYNALILPHLDYCSVVWGKCNKTDLLKLQRSQNRYARLVLRTDYSTPKEELLRQLKWLSIENRIDYQYCIAVYKILNDMAPYYLNGLASKRPVYYITRYSTLNPLFIPKPNTKFKQRSFSFTAPHIYNNLPTQIRTSTTLQSFKNQTRRLFLSSIK